MSDTPTPVVLPPLINSFVTSYARQGLTVLAGILATHGFALSQSQSQTMVEQGIALALFVASLAWTYFQNRLNAKRLQVAASPGVVDAQNPPPGPVVGAPVKLDDVVKAS